MFEYRARIIETCLARLVYLPNIASLIQKRLGAMILQDMLGPETLEGQFLLYYAIQNLVEYCVFLLP